MWHCALFVLQAEERLLEEQRLAEENKSQLAVNESSEKVGGVDGGSADGGGADGGGADGADEATEGEEQA